MYANLKAQVTVTGMNVRINRNGKIKEYDLMKTKSFKSYARLYKLAHKIPQSHFKSTWRGFTFYWIYQRSMINWQPRYNAAKAGYWEAYHDINSSWYGEGNAYNRRRAFEYALKYYGWTHKEFYNAEDTMREIQAGTE